jgi:hypothetical protein
MRKTGRSGRSSSIWNKNLCSVYSRIVHMIFPTKKHMSVLMNASNGMLDRADNGRAASMVKAGRGPANCKRERRKRYVLMGPHIRGTTYHFATVQIWWDK